MLQKFMTLIEFKLTLKIPMSKHEHTNKVITGI